MLKLIITFSYLLLFTEGKPQGLTKIEEHHLDSLLDRYFESSDWEHSSNEIAFGTGPSSFYILSLSLDSIGKVIRLRLLGDIEYKDSIYAIFSRLKIKHFQSFQSIISKNKSIIIPLIYYSPHGEPAYMRDFIDKAFTPGIYNETIVLEKMVFGWGRWHRFGDPIKNN